MTETMKFKHVRITRESSPYYGRVGTVEHVEGHILTVQFSDDYTYVGRDGVEVIQEEGNDDSNS